MNSKERVQAALNHVQPDRVPVDYLGTPEADSKLMNHFGAQDMNEVLDALEVDLRHVREKKLPYIGPDLGGADIFGVRFKRVPNNVGGVYDEPDYQPFAEMITEEEALQYPFPSPDWFDYSVLPDMLSAWSDKAIVFGGTGWGDMINSVAYGRGVEKVMYDIAERNPVYRILVQRRVDFFLAVAERMFEAVRGKAVVDIVYFGDDMGSQNGPLISLSTYDELFRDHQQKFIDLAHAYGAKAMMHCCGGTRPFFPAWIEMGLDVYDTVQAEAVGMDPDALKRDFGDKICFHGTVSTQKTLPFGTVDDVREEARTRIETVGKGGGLILAPAHNIQADTPLENILALYQTARC